MNEKDFSKIMERLEDFYPNFYAGRDKQKTFDLWYPLFRKDTAEDMARAVTICICTLKFAPSVAEIKTQMAECRLEDQPTSIEAFHTISDAVKKSYNRDTSIEAFKGLPPILRKLVGDPSYLVDWHRVSDEAFQTVIMSAIRESYSTLVKREAKYYALPEGLQKLESWRIQSPSIDALPEPTREVTLDEMIADREKKSEEYRDRYGMEPNPDYADRVAAFQAPMTAEDLKRMEYVERKKDALLKKIGV